MTWIYAFPAWAVAIATIFVLSAVASAMVLAVRAFVPPETRRANDVAGPIASVVGTFLAVLLSFMLVTVWQEYVAADQSSANEAAGVSDLEAVARTLPSPARERLQAVLRKYASAIENEEWPSMRSGAASALADRLSGDLLGIVVGYEPRTHSQIVMQSVAIGYVGTIQDSRRDRLFDNQQGIPKVLWAGIAAIVLVTLALCSLFSIKSRTMHVATSIAVASAIAMMLVLTAEFDYPFRGDVQLPPSAWQGAIPDSSSR